MIVVAIIGILSAIAVPAWAKSRNTARLKVCVNNLKQILYAKGQWAFEQHKGDAQVPTLSEVTPYLQNGDAPSCPAGGAYDLHSVAEIPTCTLAAEGHTL